MFWQRYGDGLDEAANRPTVSPLREEAEQVIGHLLGAVNTDIFSVHWGVLLDDLGSVDILFEAKARVITKSRGLKLVKIVTTVVAIE